MCSDTTAFIGPDFIGQLAERQLQDGLETDALILDSNAKAWRRDRETIDQQDRELTALRDRLATTGAALRVPGIGNHAITPTDRR